MGIIEDTICPSASLWMVEHRTTRAHASARLRGSQHPEARFALTMADLGSVRSRGIAPGWTPLRRALGFAIWPDGDPKSTLATDDRETADARAWWQIDLSVHAVRGSWRGDHLADLPLTGVGQDDGPLAVLTLGRTPLRRFPRFTLRELPAIARDAATAPGLLHAAAAGSPLTGSITFTVWRDRRSLRAFAKAPRSAHARTVRNDARLGLLSEQLVLMFRVAAIRGRWERSADAAALSALAAALPDQAGG